MDKLIVFFLKTPDLVVFLLSKYIRANTINIFF